MANKKIDLSIIIINYKTPDLTVACLESIRKYVKNINYEVILIDNNSQDGSVNKFKKLQYKNFDLKVICNSENLGFAKANNQGIKISKAKYILLLNSDTEFTFSFLDKMINYMDDNEDIGISTCALLNKDKTYQVSGGYFPNLANVFTWMTIQDLPLIDKLVKPFHPKKAFTKKHQLDWVTGAFFLIRSEVIKEVGLLDEDYFMYTEEVDFCFRVKKAGWKVLLLPKWSIIHYGGASSVREFAILQETKGVKLFFKKHYSDWQSLFLRLFLKTGYMWRIFLVSPKIYWKAFKLA